MIDVTYSVDVLEARLKAYIKAMTQPGDLDVSVYTHGRKIKLEGGKVYIYENGLKAATLWVDDKDLIQGHVSTHLPDDLTVILDQAITDLEPFRNLREGLVL